MKGPVKNMLMKKDEIKQYIGLKTMSLVDAMKQIDSNSMGLIYVVNESENNMSVMFCSSSMTAIE